MFMGFHPILIDIFVSWFKTYKVKFEKKTHTDIFTDWNHADYHLNDSKIRPFCHRAIYKIYLWCFLEDGFAS